MSDYQSGDRVRILESEYNCIDVGEVLEVDYISQHDSVLVSTPNHSNSLCFWDHQLELVSKSESDMSNPDSDYDAFAVPVESKEMSTLLQRTAFQEGFKWAKDGKVVETREEKFLHFRLNGTDRITSQDKEITYSTTFDTEDDINHPVLPNDFTMQEFIAALNGEYGFDSAPEFEDTLSGYDVEYDPSEDMVEVGCHIFDASNVLEFAEKLREIREYHDNS